MSGKQKSAGWNIISKVTFENSADMVNLIRLKHLTLHSVFLISLWGGEKTGLISLLPCIIIYTSAKWI